MEVDINPFPKLVDVDVVTINWTSNDKKLNIEKASRNVTLTPVAALTSQHLIDRASSLDFPILKGTPRMADHEKAILECPNAMTWELELCNNDKDIQLDKDDFYLCDKCG